jgi:hypothetical protein
MAACATLNGQQLDYVYFENARSPLGQQNYSAKMRRGGCIITKRKPQAGCRLGLLSRLNLGFWSGRHGVGGWSAASLS